MKKRWLALLLALVMLVSVLPTAALAADANEVRTDAQLTVTYNANGGTFERYNEADNTYYQYTAFEDDNNGAYYKAGDRATVQSFLPYKQDGGTYYVFDGWMLEGQSGLLHEGDTFTMPGASVTLTAQWSLWASEYDVVYDANGGAFEDGTLTPAEYYYDGPYAEDAEVSQTALVPVKANSIFRGWKLLSPARLSWRANGTSFVMPDCEVVFQAVWTQKDAVTTYEVTYDANGGRFDDGCLTHDDGYYAYGDRVWITAEEPARSGYTFAGWWPDYESYWYDWTTDDYDFFVKYGYFRSAYAYGDSYTMPRRDVTFYAIWVSNGYTYDGYYDLNSAYTDALCYKKVTGLDKLPKGYTAKFRLEDRYGNVVARGVADDFTWKSTGRKDTDGYYISRIVFTPTRYYTEDYLYSYTGTCYLPAGEYTLYETSVTDVDDHSYLDDGPQTVCLNCSRHVDDFNGATIVNDYDYWPWLIARLDKSYLNSKDHNAYVYGYPDGTVRPEGRVTRAEVAGMIYRLLNKDVRDYYRTSYNSFKDVARSAWYNEAVSTLAYMGVIDGYSDGTFRPDNEITRAEFAAILASFDGDSRSWGVEDFKDVSGHWAQGSISIVYNDGWVDGYADGTFRPDAKLTRAEAVTMLNRMLNRQPASKEDLVAGMTQWKDNLDTNAWYYLAIQEAGNSHDYHRYTETGLEYWTNLVR